MGYRHRAISRPPPLRFLALRERLRELECAAAVAFGPVHAVHLTGYDRYLALPAAVVIDADARRTLVVAAPELAPAEAEAAADDVVTYGSEDLLLDLDQSPALIAACRRVAGTDRVALAGTYPLTAAWAARYSDGPRIDGFLAALRRRKDADEVDRITDSINLALLAQRELENLAGDGRTEIELFAAAHAVATEAAGRPIEWIATVAGGANSALISPPFCVAGPVAAEAPLLCDIAVRHRGYWGDTARTYGGTDEIETIRRELTELRDATAVAARPGVRACELFTMIRDGVGARLPGATFAHHGGHGLGIEVGEDPQLLPAEPMPLEDGMVIAIEPAAYFAGRYGVRVENTYRITADGGVALGGLAR